MKRILVLLAVFLIFVSTSSIVFAAKTTLENGCNTIKSGTIVDSVGIPISLGYDKWGYNYEAHMFNGWYDNNTRPADPVTGGDRLMMKWNDAWLSNKDCSGDKKLDRHFGFDSYLGSGAWLTNHASGTYTKYFDWVVNTETKTIDIPWNNTIYSYSVNFVQDGTTLTGTLTDTYCNPDCEGPLLNGTITGDNVTFAFAYPVNQTQGVRTYNGTIDSSGKVSGTWSDAGSDHSKGDWSISNFATQMPPQMCEWSDFVKIVAVPSDATKTNGYWHTVDGVEIGSVIWGDFALIQEVASDPCGEYDLMNYKSELRSGLGNW